ncbi:BTAD domain-containing putative transcriptional regulator [Streptomyces sp. NPDC021969]|uniref:AfsR/SARP family transcriptional regulator n=1 Tax=unclassified Streptomyces TaxID=2593676 RepID=UPI0033E338B9
MVGESPGAVPDGERPCLTLLGPLQVRGPDGPLHVTPGRQQVILAALLLRAGQVVGTDHLVDLLWGDAPPKTARAQVQICVSRLRTLLGRAARPATIATRPSGYVLTTEPGNVDAALFTALVAEARRLGREGRREEAVTRLRTAAALWQGDCLSGLDNHRLAHRTRHLDEERLAATELRVQLELELDRHEHLTGELEVLVGEHPLRERLRGQLMTALYRSGRRADALRTYRRGRDLLIRELGLEPGAELRGLEAAVLADRLSPGAAPGIPAGSAAPPAPRPPDAATGPASDPPGPGPVVPRQLPADVPDFVAGPGRPTELEAVLAGDDRTAGDDGTAGNGTGRNGGPVVITGKPGTGKSATAVRLAHRLAATAFPDGQLYCDLRGTTASPATPTEVLGRFLRALGVPGELIPESPDERAESYRTRIASRRILVVLDDAADEGQVLPLLPGSGPCRVVVTSRSGLTALPGAHRVEVDVLDEERALELLARVVGRPRVDRERPAAEALVRTVGRLPLALRIVAARLAARPHWTLAAMVHRLADERRRLDELTHGGLTVRGSLSPTYDALEEKDRRLLRLLSMARTPTLPGWLAGALADDRRPCLTDLFDPLVGAGLLDVAGVDGAGDFQYRFHELTRVYAGELLAAQDGGEPRGAALARMAGGWLHLAQEAHRRVHGGDFAVLHGDAPRWSPPKPYVDRLLTDPVAWLDAERGALCRMVEHAADEGLHDLSWDLATTLVTLFEVRGHHDLWERTHLRALEAVTRAGNLRGTAAVRAGLGSLHLRRGQAASARNLLESALGLFLVCDDPRGRALCRRDLALLARREGDHATAGELYARAMEDFAACDDPVGRAGVLTQSTHVLLHEGREDAARRQLDEASGIYASLGHTIGRARTLHRSGQLLLERGDAEQALAALSEALEMCRACGDVVGAGHLLHDMGRALTALGRTRTAREHHKPEHHEREPAARGGSRT